MPQDTSNELGQPSSPKPPPGIDPKAAKEAEKLVDSLGDVLEKADKVQKQNEKIFKQGKEQQKQTEKYIKTVDKEVDSLKEKKKQLDLLKKASDENLKVQKELNKESASAAKKDVGPNFTSLIKSTAIIKSIGAALKKNIGDEVDSVTRNLDKNATGWAAVGIAAIYATKEASNYVKAVKDGAINFAKFNKSLRDSSKNSLIAPGGIEQLEEVRKSLGQTTDQFSEFLDIAKEAPFANAADKLGAAALKLKETFGGDQNKRLREYVDLLKEIPTIDTDLSITATVDDTAAAYFDLAEKGKVGTVIDLQSAGLAGGAGGGAPTDAAAKKDNDLLTTAQNTDATLENIEKTLASFLPNSLVALTGIGSAVLGLGAGVYEAFVIAATTKQLLGLAKQPVGTPPENATAKHTEGTVPAINLVRAEVAKAAARNLVASRSATGRGSPPGAVAVAGRGALGGVKGIVAGAVTDAVAGPLIEAVKNKVGLGGGGIGSDLVDAEITNLETKLIGKFGKLGQISEAGFGGLKKVLSPSSFGKALTKIKGLGGAAETGITAGIGKAGFGLVKGLGLGLVAAAAEYASSKLYDFGKDQVDAAKELRDSLGDTASSAQQTAISNKILLGSVEKAGGSLGKFAASIAGAALLGSSFGPIGTAVAGVTAALIGLPDFLDGFGSSLVDIDKELKPGLFKGFVTTLTEVALFGPVFGTAAALLGVSLTDVGKGMQKVSASALDAFDSLKAFTTGVDVKFFKDQRKAQADLAQATKELYAVEKKGRDEAIKIQKVQQKSALGLQLHFKQIENAAKTGAVRLFEFNKDLANLKLGVFETVGGSLDDFNSALQSSTENVVKGFEKLISTLQLTEKEILEDSSLNANDRKEALDKLNERELEAQKKFRDDILHTADQIGKAPGIVKNRLKSTQAKNQTDFEQKRGGADTDTLIQRYREEEARNLQNTTEAQSNYITATEANTEALGKSQEALDKSAASAVDTILNKSGARTAGGTAESDAPQALKDAADVIQNGLDSSGKLTQGATQQLTGQLKDLTQTIEDEQKAFEAKSTGASSSSREDQIAARLGKANSEKIALTTQKDTANKAGDKGARNEAGKERNAKQAEINDLEEQFALAEKDQLSKLNEQEDFTKRLNDADKRILSEVLNGTGTLKDLEKGTADQKTAVVHIRKVRKELANNERGEKSALEARIRPLQDTVTLIKSATKNTDQSVLAEEQQTRSLENLLKSQNESYDSEVQFLDEIEKSVTNNKDVQKALANKEAAQKELEAAASGGDFGTALNKLAEVVDAAGKATQSQVTNLNKELDLIPQAIAKVNGNIASNNKELEDIAKRRDSLKRNGAGDDDARIINLNKQENLLKTANVNEEGKILDLTKREAKARGEKVTAESNFVRELVASVSEAERAGKARLNIEGEINDAQLDFANTIGASAGQIFKLQQQGLAIESAKFAVSKKALSTLGEDYQKALGEAQADPKNQDKQVALSQVELAYKQKTADVAKEGYELQKKAFGAQRDAFEKLLGSAFGAIRQSVGTRKGVGTNAAIFGQNRVENKLTGLVTKGGSSSIEDRQAGLANAAGGGVGTNPTRSPVEGLIGNGSVGAGTPTTLGAVGGVNAAIPYGGLNATIKQSAGATSKDPIKLQQSTVDYSKQSVDIQSKLLSKQDDIISAIMSQSEPMAAQTSSSVKSLAVLKKDFTIQKKNVALQEDAVKTAVDSAKANDISDIKQTGFLDRLPKPVEVRKQTQAIQSTANASQNFGDGDFSKGIISGLQDMFSNISDVVDVVKQIPNVLSPSSSIQAAPQAPGGATAGNSQVIKVNIKVDVEFDDDMFRAKVRQIVTKDPDIRNSLSQVFVSSGS